MRKGLKILLITLFFLSNAAVLTTSSALFVTQSSYSVPTNIPKGTYFHTIKGFTWPAFFRDIIVNPTSSEESSGPPPCQLLVTPPAINVSKFSTVLDPGPYLINLLGSLTYSTQSPPNYFANVESEKSLLAGELAYFLQLDLRNGIFVSQGRLEQLNMFYCDATSLTALANNYIPGMDKSVTVAVAGGPHPVNVTKFPPNIQSLDYDLSVATENYLRSHYQLTNPGSMVPQLSVPVASSYFSDETNPYTRGFSLTPKYEMTMISNLLRKGKGWYTLTQWSTVPGSYSNPGNLLGLVPGNGLTISGGPGLTTSIFDSSYTFKPQSYTTGLVPFTNTFMIIGYQNDSYTDEYVKAALSVQCSDHYYADIVNGTTISVSTVSVKPAAYCSNPNPKVKKLNLLDVEYVTRNDLAGIATAWNHVKPGIDGTANIGNLIILTEGLDTQTVLEKFYANNQCLSRQVTSDTTTPYLLFNANGLGFYGTFHQGSVSYGIDYTAKILSARSASTYDLDNTDQDMLKQFPYTVLNTIIANPPYEFSACSVTDGVIGLSYVKDLHDPHWTDPNGQYCISNSGGATTCPPFSLATLTETQNNNSVKGMIAANFPGFSTPANPELLSASIGWSAAQSQAILLENFDLTISGSQYFNLAPFISFLGSTSSTPPGSAIVIGNIDPVVAEANHIANTALTVNLGPIPSLVMPNLFDIKKSTHISQVTYWPSGVNAKRGRYFLPAVTRAGFYEYNYNPFLPNTNFSHYLPNSAAPSVNGTHHSFFPTTPLMQCTIWANGPVCTDYTY